MEEIPDREPLPLPDIQPPTTEPPQVLPSPPHPPQAADLPEDVPLATTPELPRAEDDGYPSVRVLARWLLVAVALYGIGWLLWQAGSAMLPFIIGLVLAYLLLPIVNLLNQRMSRAMAILSVYLGGLVLLAVAIAYIIPPVVDQLKHAIDSTPSLDQLQAMGNELLQEYRSSVPEAVQKPIEDGLRNALRTLQTNISGYIQTVGSFLVARVVQLLNTVTFLVGFLIIPIWLFFVLNDQAKARKLINNVLHPRLRADFWNTWRIIDKVLSDYIRGQLLLGVIVGVMVGLLLFGLRVFGIEIRYILLLAILAGITELIPIIGPVIGAIPGIVIGFTISPTAGLAALAVYVAVQQLENNFLVPKFLGESIGIHPAILTVVLIAMGQVFGLLGVILAAPLAAIARDLFLYTYRRLEGYSAAAAHRSLSSTDSA